MSQTLQNDRQVFIEKRKEDALQAAQSFALQMSCGIDLLQITAAINRDQEQSLQPS